MDEKLTDELERRWIFLDGPYRSLVFAVRAHNEGVWRVRFAQYDRVAALTDAQVTEWKVKAV